MKLLLVGIISAFSAVHRSISAPTPTCNNNNFPDPYQLFNNFFRQNEGKGPNDLPSTLPMMMPMMVLMPYPFYKSPCQETGEEQSKKLPLLLPSAPTTISTVPLKRKKAHKVTPLNVEKPESFAPSSTQLGAAIKDALLSLKELGKAEDGKRQDSPSPADTLSSLKGLGKAEDGKRLDSPSTAAGIVSRLFSPITNDEGSYDDDDYEDDETSDRRSLLFYPLAKFASKTLKNFAGSFLGDYEDEGQISQYERQQQLESAYKLGASEGQLEAIKNAKTERELALLRKDLDSERERNRAKDDSYREGKLEGKLDGQNRNGHLDIHSIREKMPRLTKDNDEEKNYTDEGNYKDGSNKYSKLWEMMQKGNEPEDRTPSDRENWEPSYEKGSKPNNRPESKPSSRNPEGRKRGGAAGSAAAEPKNWSMDQEEGKILLNAALTTEKPSTASRSKIHHKLRKDTPVTVIQVTTPLTPTSTETETTEKPFKMCPLKKKHSPTTVVPPGFPSSSQQTDNLEEGSLQNNPEHDRSSNLEPKSPKVKLLSKDYDLTTLRVKHT